MPLAIAALPDDPEILKAMLLAERARNERLEQIIKEMSAAGLCLMKFVHTA